MLYPHSRAVLVYCTKRNKEQDVNQFKLRFMSSISTSCKFSCCFIHFEEVNLSFKKKVDNIFFFLFPVPISLINLRFFFQHSKETEII